MGAYNSSTGIISASGEIFLSDVQDALGAARSVSLGECCCNKLGSTDISRINKWALHKSMRSSKDTPLTESEVAAMHCGLSPRAVAKILGQSIGYTGGLTTYSLDDCIAEILEWIYLVPRGINYNERSRISDFRGYNKNAIAPDSGWSSRAFTKANLVKMAALTMSVTSTSPYSGRNFKLVPQYSGSTCNDFLYSSFNMRFGDATGESIGTVTNMDIPIKRITELSGCWRLALAVWVPSFNSNNGGWALFASRMTIAQYFTEQLGSGDNLRWLFPDLGTNPYAASLLNSYVGSAYKTLTAVPLLVKNLAHTTINGLFALYAVSGETEAYCIPSGSYTSLEFGDPAMPLYYEVTYPYEQGVTKAVLKNTDTAASHTFTYTLTIVASAGATPTVSTGEATLAAGASQVVGAAPTGGSVNVVVTKQDGVVIE